jgi:hypothetical protein
MSDKPLISRRNQPPIQTPVLPPADGAGQLCIPQRLPAAGVHPSHMLGRRLTKRNSREERRGRTLPCRRTLRCGPSHCRQPASRTSSAGAFARCMRRSQVDTGARQAAQRRAPPTCGSRQALRRRNHAPASRPRSCYFRHRDGGAYANHIVAGFAA